MQTILKQTKGTQMPKGLYYAVPNLCKTNLSFHYNRAMHLSKPSPFIICILYIRAHDSHISNVMYENLTQTIKPVQRKRFGMEAAMLCNWRASRLSFAVTKAKEKSHGWSELKHFTGDENHWHFNGHWQVVLQEQVCNQMQFAFISVTAIMI